MNCRDKVFWRSLLDQELSETEIAAGHKHLSTCAACRDLFGEVGADAKLATDMIADPLAGEPETDPSAAWARFQSSRTGAGSSRSAVLRRWRPALAGAVVAAFVLLLTLAPVQTFATNVLQLFRLEKFEAVQFDPSELTEFDPAAFGEFTSTPPEPVTLDPSDPGSLSKAGEILGRPVVEPTGLPAGFERTGVFATGQANASLTFDLDLIRAYAQARGIQGVVLPDKLDGATVTGSVPAHVMIGYGDTGGPEVDSLLTFLQGSVPTLETDADVDVDAVRESLLRLLPTELSDQLSAMSDWRSTLPIPVPRDEARSEEVVVAGKHQGIYLTGISQPFQALVWTAGDHVFALLAAPDFLGRAELFRIAASVPTE